MRTGGDERGHIAYVNAIFDSNAFQQSREGDHGKPHNRLSDTTGEQSLRDFLNGSPSLWSNALERHWKRVQIASVDACTCMTCG